MGGGVVISVIMEIPTDLLCPFQTPDRTLTRRNQMLRDDDIFSKVEQKSKQTKTDGSFPFYGEQGWRSSESARLPPMWPGFKSWRRHHMWVEFVVGSLPCSEKFFSGYYGFPLSSKTNIFKFQFDQESVRRRTTMWMYYLQIVIYLFIYLLFIHLWPGHVTNGYCNIQWI